MVESVPGSDVTPENRKMTVRERLMIWGVATGIASILGVYIYAGSTEEHSPIRVPATARPLPWPNGNLKPFIVEASQTQEVDCGSVHTFLGSLYDGSMDEAKSIESINAYERTFEAAQGIHTNAGIAAIRIAVAANPNGKVVTCSPAPSVIYENR